jgi:type II secretory pathway pseudopilin PulG
VTVRRRKRAGFTVLEAAVALAIIGLTAVGVLGAFGADLRGAERSRDLLTATSLAQSQLARLEVSGALERSSLPDSLGAGTFAAPLDRYRWMASSAAVPGEADLYDLRVVVEWADGRFALRSRRYRPVPLVVGR